MRRPPEAVEAAIPPLTLAEVAARAEHEAMVAHDLARNAHRAALAAASRAARLRADAAAEAAAEAGMALAKAELDADFALFETPRSRPRGQAA